MYISAGDHFVIGAALTLIARAADDLSFDDIKLALDAVRQSVGPKTREGDDAPGTTSAVLVPA